MHPSLFVFFCSEVIMAIQVFGVKICFNDTVKCCGHEFDSKSEVLVLLSFNLTHVISKENNI